MFKTVFTSLALPMALLLFACGGDSTSTGPRTAAEIQADWDAHCDTFASCPQNPRDAAECKAEYPCREALMRAEALDRMTACERDRACGTSDDGCYTSLLEGVEATSVAEQFRGDCLAKQASCTGSGGTFSEDDCIGAKLDKDSIVQNMAACLDSACPDIRDCLHAAETAPACPF
jgi:hypothetical protein